MESTPMRRNVRTATALHPRVYGALVFCTLWVVAAIWAFFATNSYTALQLAVVAFFAAVFLLVPIWLLRLSRNKPPKAPSFHDWANGEFEIADGRVEGRHAMAMVLIAPVAVVAGITAIGFVAYLAASGAI